MNTSYYQSYLVTLRAKLSVTDDEMQDYAK